MNFSFAFLEMLEIFIMLKYEYYQMVVQLLYSRIDIPYIHIMYTTNVSFITAFIRN